MSFDCIFLFDFALLLYDTGNLLYPQSLLISSRTLNCTPILLLFIHLLE